ncbi:unnamed protein product [Effrenium voratum]|uniref:Uncharacterized protein n=1 Tax=Effrenium voratum TaxID=2562239 RepID=A0AA36JDJ7_9DINO|nr:unnamed protein product [Effrenium voratum]
MFVVCIFLHRPFFSVPVVVQGLEVVEALGGRSLPCAEEERELSWEELVPLVDTTVHMDSFYPDFMRLLLDRPHDMVPVPLLMHAWAMWTRSAIPGWRPIGVQGSYASRPGLLQCWWFGTRKHGEDMFSYLHAHGVVCRPATSVSDVMAPLAMPVKSSSPIVCPAFSGRLRIEVQPPGAVGKPACAECGKRMLITNLWLVKTLMYQVTTSRKRQKVGENLHTDVQEECRATWRPDSGGR